MTTPPPPATAPPPRASGLLFLHIMKTGGTSASATFKDHFAAAAYPAGTAPEKLARKTFPDELLAMDGDQERAIEFLSVHMGAGIIDRLTPGRLTCTVLREPVARSVSHLRQIAASLDRTLDDVYDEPRYRDRISNYQTRVLSATVDATTPNEHVSPDDLTPDQQRDLFDELGAVWSTAIPTAGDIHPDALQHATERLRSIDVVGTNKHLASFVSRVGSMLGVEFAAPKRLRVSTETQPPSAALLRRLQQDNQLDVELFHEARRREGTTP